MKHIFLNLKSFVKNEKIIFFVIIICVISSSFIINFSYGIFYNYTAEKNESTDQLKELVPAVNEGQVLTVGDVKRLVEALGEDIQAEINAYVILTSKEQTEHRFSASFSYENGKYSGDGEGPSNITEGRYISTDDIAEGRYVAFVNTDYFTQWNPECLEWLNDDGTISLYGNKYEIIGKGKDFYGAVIIPFTTYPNDLGLMMFGFTFNRVISRKVYDEILFQASVTLPGVLQFPELPMPDIDSIAVYNNMIVISGVISVLSIVNFAMLYQFTLKKRQRQLAIMRICGCKRVRAVFTYLGECLLITIPSYLIGVVLNKLITDNNINGRFNYISEAYTPKVYITLFGVYMIIFVILLLVMILKTVNKTIVQEWRE